MQGRHFKPWEQVAALNVHCPTPFSTQCISQLSFSLKSLLACPLHQQSVVIFRKFYEVNVSATPGNVDQALFFKASLSSASLMLFFYPSRPFLSQSPSDCSLYLYSIFKCHVFLELWFYFLFLGYHICSQVKGVVSISTSNTALFIFYLFKKKFINIFY